MAMVRSDGRSRGSQRGGTVATEKEAGWRAEGIKGEGLQGRELRGHFRWRLHELPLPVAQHTVPLASAASAVVASSFFRPFSALGPGWFGRSLF